MNDNYRITEMTSFIEKFVNYIKTSVEDFSKNIMIHKLVFCVRGITHDYDIQKFAAFCNILMEYGMEKRAAVFAYCIYIGGFLLPSNMMEISAFSNIVRRVVYKPFSRRICLDCDSVNLYIAIMTHMLDKINNEDIIDNNGLKQDSVAINHDYTINRMAYYSYMYGYNCSENRTNHVFLVKAAGFYSPRNAYGVVRDFLYHYFVTMNYDVLVSEIWNRIEEAWSLLLHSEE